MPEGDTIHKLAARVGPLLIGQPLVRVTTQGLARAATGRTVTAVSAHGKHLLIELDDGSYVRTHLGMYGRQRSYPRAEGEAVVARMSPGRATLVLVTAAHVLIWIGARQVEIAARRAPHHGGAIASLGPDLLADDFDPAVAAARAAAQPHRRIADVLLDQRVAAGIGNVYKSEVLFLHGVDPRTRVGTLTVELLTAIYETAREVMRDNLGPGPRTTRDKLAGDRPGDDRYFVYGRSGKPCRRCATAHVGQSGPGARPAGAGAGAPIECYALGEPPRWTWSCPRCQPPPAPPPPAGGGAATEDSG